MARRTRQRRRTASRTARAERNLAARITIEEGTVTDSIRRDPDEPVIGDETTQASHQETTPSSFADSDETVVQPTRSEQTVSHPETMVTPPSRTRPVSGSHALGGDDFDRTDEDRRREEYGGFNLGAAFFGWLVAIALTVLLASILGAIAAAVGNELNFTQNDAQREAGTVGISTAVALLIVLMIAYFAGGYVAGRMSRYDGGRQGMGVWLIGLVVTMLVVLIGIIAGSQYDIFQRIDLPSFPVPTDKLTTGGIIAVAAVLLGTLLAAFLGGKMGERYHRKIDRITA